VLHVLMLQNATGKTEIPSVHARVSIRKAFVVAIESMIQVPVIAGSAGLENGSNLELTGKMFDMA